MRQKSVYETRVYSGLVAQRAEEAFARHGLNASEYGFFCRDSGEEMPELRDEEGEVYQEYQPAFTKCGIRYEEALVLEAALQRRNYKRLEERLMAL